MRCMLCGAHANFEHTLFQGTTAVQVRLCDTHASEVSATERLDKIRQASDHDQRREAVDEFLKAVGK